MERSDDFIGVSAKVLIRWGKQLRMDLGGDEVAVLVDLALVVVETHLARDVFEFLL